MNIAPQRNVYKDMLKDLTTDELLDMVGRLPVSTFGYREFETYQQAISARVSADYPESMIVIEIEQENGNTVSLLLSNIADKQFKAPVFIG